MKPPLRVAVLDRGSGGADWPSILAWRSVDLVTTQSVPALAASGADYGLVCVGAMQLADLTAELAVHPEAPPLAILVGTAGREHPHARVLRSVIQAKRQWEAIFDALVDPVAVLDGAGAVMRANLGLARSLGRDVAELVGARYAELLGPALPGSVDPIAESLADGRARTGEARYRDLAGVRLVTTSPLPETAEGPAGLAVLLKDVTEHKEEQERLLQSARLADIGQLAAGVAHEINTPLASIALRAESLLKSAEDPRLREIESFKNFPRYLKTMEQETFRCKRIIGALLEFSSSRKREARPVDLNALAEGAADLVGHQAKLKQVVLALRLEPELPAIPADDGQLRQVLIALLMNALDATPAGGHVAVETRRDEDRVVLTVADDGAGIPPEIRDKIFSPFFTTKPVGKGTGLGLAICHGIITAHGGEILVESEVGSGTRVSVALPLSAARP